MRYTPIFEQKNNFGGKNRNIFPPTSKETAPAENNATRISVNIADPTCNSLAVGDSLDRNHRDQSEQQVNR